MPPYSSEKHTVSIFQCQRVSQRQKNWHGDVQWQRLSYSEPYLGHISSHICIISFTLDLPFDTEDEGSISLHNICKNLTEYTASYLGGRELFHFCGNHKWHKDVCSFMKPKFHYRTHKKLGPSAMAAESNSRRVS